MPDSSAEHWADEIRSWLLGRVATTRDRGKIQSRGVSGSLPRRAELWWILEGKRYPWFESSLSSDWAFIEHQIRRLLSTYNPVWRPLTAPEGQTDWVASAFATATSNRPMFVSKASSAGLAESERRALLGWQSWITQQWSEFTSAVGVPVGCNPLLPWQAGPVRPRTFDARQLRRWAHTAKRSRWPLLRNVVAESLRCVLEPQELHQLPLPTDSNVLFELLCMVRILDALEGAPTSVRWLDPENDNTVRLPGLRYHFQYNLDRGQVLRTDEFANGLREAMARHRVRVHQRIDGWLVFDEPRAGFDGVLVEAKSGDYQKPHDTIYQLKAYRAALKTRSRQRLLIWGITKAPVELREPLPVAPSTAAEPTDHWVFSSAEDIADVLASLGLTTSKSRRTLRGRVSAGATFSAPGF